MFRGRHTRIRPPASAQVIHHSGALWCPIAKVASTSIFDALKIDKAGYLTHSIVLAKSLSLAQRQSLCESTQRHVTFTITRDPFDRLASAYLEKVVLATVCDLRLDPLASR